MTSVQLSTDEKRGQNVLPRANGKVVAELEPGIQSWAAPSLHSQLLASKTTEMESPPEPGDVRSASLLLWNLVPSV